MSEAEGAAITSALTQRSERQRRRAERRAARKARRAAAAQAEAAAREPTPAERALEERAAKAIAKVTGPVTGFIKATSPDTGGYAVFANANRRSVLRCPLTGSGMVDYIAMRESTLSVESCTEMYFNTIYERAEYDPKRAAKVYAEAARWRGITEDAKTHLERALGTPLKNLKTQHIDATTSKRRTEMKNGKSMYRNNDAASLEAGRTFISNGDDPQQQGGGDNAAASAAPTPPAASAPKKATPKKAAAKPTPKKAAAPKKAAKPTPKKAAAPKKEKPAPTGKRAELRAKRIKVIISKNPKREGTNAWKKFEVYKTAKTVGEALEKGAKVGFKMSTINYDLKHKFIQLV